MATLSVSVPDELKNKMLKLDEINWSAVARKAFEQKIEEADMLNKIAAKSKLTEKDAREIGRKISEGMAVKFRGM